MLDTTRKRLKIVRITWGKHSQKASRKSRKSGKQECGHGETQQSWRGNSNDLIDDVSRIFTRPEFTLDQVSKLQGLLVSVKMQFVLDGISKEWFDGFRSAIEVATCVALGDLPSFDIDDGGEYD